MQVPLQIAFEGMEPSPEIEKDVRERAEKLERYSDQIISCRVVVEMPHQRHEIGNLYNVKIHVTMPDKGDIVVARNPEKHHAHEEIGVTLRDAFDAARRQLEDWERKHGGRTKRHETPPHGRVVRIYPEEGYGFIAASDGREIYFHRNSVAHDAFDKLEEGSEVRFAESIGDEGPQASTVQLIGKHHVV